MVGFTLPPRQAVGFLDPEIAGEGVKVILSDGKEVNFSPPPPKPSMPDWSQIKAIRHYFGRTDYQVFPAWLYHQDGSQCIVKNGQEAAELGVKFRESTVEERGRYGVQHVWDWAEDSKWRPKPWTNAKFEPDAQSNVKNFIRPVADPMAAQAELLRGLIRAFESGGLTKPTEMSDDDWKEFQQFVAFKKAQAQVTEKADKQSGSVNGLLQELAESHHHKKAK